jgi:hypothetical protein
MPTPCRSCGLLLDADDRFCRRCGSAVAEASLPATRSPDSVTIWRPHTSPVVKGAAVMAAGTIGQFLMRRAIGSVLAPRKKRRALRIGRGGDDGMHDEAQIITETVMMRRVRIRRPA